MRSRRRFADLDASAEAALITAARNSEPVNGLTHRFYKYPARFSPLFVRAAIECFTKPGQLVLDPHVGGGTTLVEALALGRDAIGVDISSLAEFVARVKTTVLSQKEMRSLAKWSGRVANAIDVRKPSRELSDYAALGYYKHLEHPTRWRLRKAIEQALSSAAQLGSPRLEQFGRCAILRAAQLALDGRSRPVNLDGFRKLLHDAIAEMIEGAADLRSAVAMRRRRARVDVLHRSAAGLEDDPRLTTFKPPRLVVTSPPYPGVHVLYHRWQVDGRKEAALPFMIANKLDGAGSSYYTMGDRKFPQLKTYFDGIRGTMASVAALADPSTIVLQMVAFSNASWQLNRYLETMREAGLTEIFLPSLDGVGDGRLWRSVPSRRWYSEQRGTTPGSNEVVLIHRKAATRSQLQGHQFPRSRRGLADRVSSARA